jgi:hypothetical protein
VVNFCPPVSGSVLQIRIQGPYEYGSNPDPQHPNKHYTTNLELLPGIEAVSVVEADTAEEAPPSSTVTRPEKVLSI